MTSTACDSYHRNGFYQAPLTAALKIVTHWQCVEIETNVTKDEREFKEKESDNRLVENNDK